MNTSTISGKHFKNFLHGQAEGPPHKPNGRHIVSSQIKGTDATNLRPLHNATFHPAYNERIATKGQSTDGQIPGKPTAPSGIDMMGWVIIGLLVLGGLAALSK